MFTRPFHTSYRPRLNVVGNVETADATPLIVSYLPPQTSPLAPAADQPILVSNCQHRFLLVPAGAGSDAARTHKTEIGAIKQYPLDTRLADSAEIWDGMVAASKAYEVPIVGGHTILTGGDNTFLAIFYQQLSPPSMTTPALEPVGQRRIFDPQVVGELYSAHTAAIVLLQQRFATLSRYQHATPCVPT